MVSDSVVDNVREMAKKKRGNRAGKLKQCKLDARREQWLSQAKNKPWMEGWDPDHHSAHHKCGSLGRAERGRMDEEQNGSFLHKGELNSPLNIPSSLNSMLGSKDSCSNYTGSSSSVGCYSGNVTEEDEECLDDWEAVADALASNESHLHPPFDVHRDQKDLRMLQFCDEQTDQPYMECQDSRTKHVGTDSMAVSVSNRAWRPDDAFRPSCLPRFPKHGGFHNSGNQGQPWICGGVFSLPISCPICCVDLDLTDSSFLPCSCGFQLCLFCHTRIREGDGRCPGCRRPYEDNFVKEENSAHGGCLAIH